MYITSSKNGNLYFTSNEKGAEPKDGGIYNSINEEGQYRNIKRMGKEINFSGKWIAHSFIALMKVISFMMEKALQDMETVICTSASIKMVLGQNLITWALK
jgi:hypothetical protein